MAEHARREAAGDPLSTAVIANRLNAIVQEMTNTLLRAARSAVIASCRDFSCSIVTADNQLLSAAEGLPVHIFGTHLQTASMCDLHPDLAEGDAFLHNDPYLGNSHAADHAVLVPVFIDGAHLFTACAKAHQADTGNSIPTTYHTTARDVYEEGALIFSAVRVQRDYRTIDDIVRMCAMRIRVPEQWHGDFLATLGAARIAEQRLKELAAKYGTERLRNFIREWLDYSETRMVGAIRELPKARLVARGAHDPIEPFLPDGVPLSLSIDVDPAQALITVDLRDNVDCLECGLNQSEACAVSSVLNGVFNCLDPEIPHNSGSYRRVRVLLRDGCVVGRPTFPHSCSAGTTNIAARVINMTQSAFSELGDGFGLAEGGNGMGAGSAVISGSDVRRSGAPFINQLFSALNGGPGGPVSDGWVNYCNPGVSGLLYRDSIEVNEAKHPVHFQCARLVPGSSGAGRHRGAPQSEVVYGPRHDPLTVVIAGDGQHFPAKGVRGGDDGRPAAAWRVAANGDETRVGNAATVTIRPGEWLRGHEGSGGGYGPPHERDPGLVLEDVRERWETEERARTVYRVVLTCNGEEGELAVDTAATRALRRAAARLPPTTSEETA